MRMTPAQIGMQLLLGHSIRFRPMPELADRVRTGHEWLVWITGVDFGYDLVRWHEHLRTTGDGGYRRRSSQEVPRSITKAINDPAWQQVVASLSATLAD
jgi:hypothetical protein